MVKYKKDFEMKIYPGAPHAFFNETNPANVQGGGLGEGGLGEVAGVPRQVSQVEPSGERAQGLASAGPGIDSAASDGVWKKGRRRRYTWASGTMVVVTCSSTR